MQTNRRLKTITNHLYPKSLTLNETSSGSGKTSSVISAKHRRRSLKARKQSPQLPLLIQPEIREALARGGPVVALESTIISHGMPYPENVKTAKQVEEVIRSNGAIPATIAILNGVIHVGLNDEQLDTLGRLGSKVRKCSRRDLALVVANKENGATTVAGTMLVAHMVGIDVFVTGGIGGVHRGGESSLDVSADLTELGRTPVCVICAGVKSILDIPRTLEYLETQGVAVVGYGTSDFPAFFTSKSGSEAPCRLDSPHQIAQLIHSNKLLSLKSGMIVGVPIPAQFEAQAAPIEQAIQRALKEADEKKIVGKEATPFLLSRVNQLTGGASLKSNIALVLNNAKIGAQIAAKLSMITKAKEAPSPIFTRKSERKRNQRVIQFDFELPTTAVAMEFNVRYPSASSNEQQQQQQQQDDDDNAAVVEMVPAAASTNDVLPDLSANDETAQSKSKQQKPIANEEDDDDDDEEEEAASVAAEQRRVSGKALENEDVVIEYDAEQIEERVLPSA